MTRISIAKITSMTYKDDKFINIFLKYPIFFRQIVKKFMRKYLSRISGIDCETKLVPKYP